VSRPRCSVFVAMSLDGYVARVDGSIDWLDGVQRPGEDYGFQAFFDSADAIVCGRKTFETATGFPAWPYTGKRCVVLTHRALPRRPGVEAHEGEPRPLLERLGAEGVRHVYVDGGTVISQFLAARLVDAMTVSVVPVLLGDGLRLFAGGGLEQGLSLVRSRAFESGLVQLEYGLVQPRTAPGLGL